MRVGVDIEEIARFQNAPPSFLDSVFTPEELSYAYGHMNPAQHLCGLFCAKEAVKKTLDQAVILKEIVIQHNSKGRPLVALKGKVHEKVCVSISHAGAYAVASVVHEDG